MNYQEVLNATQKYKEETLGKLKDLNTRHEIAYCYTIGKAENAANSVARFFFDLLYENIEEILNEYDNVYDIEARYLTSLYMRYYDMLQGDHEAVITLYELPAEANIMFEK